MNKFTAAVTPNGDSVTVCFAGTIDENSDFNSAAVAAFKNVNFDLREINRVTSKGIRAWLLWVKKLDLRKKYSLQCSMSFVHQANLIKGLVPAWMTVKSVELPYFCEACKKGFSQIAEIENNLPPEDFALSALCPHCGESAEFDSLPERYFQFLVR
ncbi:MAG: hypothetical protein ACXWQE_11690 [Bdellovibrionales bacterium]